MAYEEIKDYSGEELLRIAIGIEHRGIMFYDVMARSTDDAAARAVFEGLVKMERVHLATFEQMLKDLGQTLPDDGTIAPDAGYLDALLDDAVFPDDMITGETAAQADSDLKAMELAISAEKDSILYYYEIRDALPASMTGLVNRILDEEKRHLEQLTAIKKSLTDS